jgi:outer membrane lipoprotein-sorting protein
MQARLLTRVAASIAMGVCVGTAAVAQSKGSGEWGQTVTKGATGAQELDAGQTAIVQKVTAYFNQMGDSKGEFTQTSADGKRLRGKIYIKRPNLFRFEYRPPSRQLIISNGTHMVVQDLDLKTDDRWGLDQTPFRIVLRKDVDLVRDAKILEVGETEDRYYIGLMDKGADARGRLKMFFLKQPAVELKEWVTTDSQDQETKVELTELVRAESLDPSLFVPTSIALQKLQQ